MNYIRARFVAKNCDRANNDILGLLKNGYKRQNKKKVLKPKPKYGILSKAISFKVVFHDDAEPVDKSKRAPRKMTIIPIGEGHNIPPVMEYKEKNVQSTKNAAQNTVQLPPRQPKNVIEAERAKNRNLKETNQIMNFSPAPTSLLFDDQPASNFIWNNSPEEINHNEASIESQHQNSDDFIEVDQQTPVNTPFFSSEDIMKMDFTNISRTNDSNAIPSTFKTNISEDDGMLFNTPDFSGGTFDTNSISSSEVSFDAMSFSKIEYDEPTKQRVDTTPSTFNEKDWTKPPQVTFEMFMERKALGAGRALARLFPEETTTITDPSFNTQSTALKSKYESTLTFGSFETSNVSTTMTDSSFSTQNTTPESKYESTPTFVAFETSNVNYKRSIKNKKTNPVMETQRKRFYADLLDRMVRGREIYKKSTGYDANKRIDQQRRVMQTKVPNKPFSF